MIRRIVIENFKAIGDRQEIELKPINLMFGPNSSGKSSVIQALHYLREVLVNRNLNPVVSEIGGSFIDFNGFGHLINERDHSKDVSIGIEFDIDQDNEDYHELALDPHADGKGFCSEEMFALPQRARATFKFRWSQLRELVYVQSLELEFDGYWFTRIRANETGTDCRIDSLNLSHPIFERICGDPSSWPENNAGETLSMLKELALTHKLAGDLEVAQKGVIVGKSLGAPCSERIIEQLSLKSVELVNKSNHEATPLERDDIQTLSMYTTVARLFDRSETFSLMTLQLPKLGKDIPVFHLSLRDALPNLDRRNPLEFDIEDAPDSDLLVHKLLTTLIATPLQDLKQILEELRYVGPLRTIPERGVRLLTREDPSRWATGLAAWDCLKISRLLAERTSKWLCAPEKLDTGFQIRAKEFYEFDATASPEDIKQYFENGLDSGALKTKSRLEFIDGTGNAHQPKDIGTGMSQIVPVLVSSLAENQPGSDQTLVIIEEPELHIHPKQQAALGDLFIECIRNGKQFFLETHSENLLLRLVRRIRHANEGVQDQQYLLTEQELQVLYVIPKGHVLNQHNGAKLIALGIDETGEFLDEWPDGFFEERETELFE